MKIIKYIFLLLLLLSCAFIVFVATQPNNYQLHKEKEIASTKVNVFNYVNDYTTWENWFDLKSTDNSTKINFTKKSSGINAGFNWTSVTTNGILKTVKTVGSDTIYQELNIDNEIHKISWSFTKSKKGTKIDWHMKGQLNFKMKMYQILQSGMDVVYGNLFESGMDRIERHLIAELESINIVHNGIVTKHATNYIRQKDSCSIKSFQANRNKITNSLIAFAKKNKVLNNDVPFIIIEKEDLENDYIIYLVCLPTIDEIVTTEGSQIKGGVLKEFLAFKTTLTGDYAHLKKTRIKSLDEINKLEDYLIDEKINSIELYKTGLPKVKNPSQWVTEIYTPVKLKKIAPVYVPEKIEPSETVKPAVVKPLVIKPLTEKVKQPEPVE